VGEDVKSGIVLDPFCGTGTTGVVSLKLGRSFVGIDLYDQFVDIAKNRCVNILNYMKENNLNPWESHK
jgi:DNA modification methylase